MKINYSKEDIPNIKYIEDPIVCYLCVNVDLNMSIGKLAAQIGHAIELIIDDYWSPKVDNKLYNGDVEIFELWRKQGRTKVVLAAHQKDFEKLKQLNNSYLIIDAGLTEVKEGSETIVAFWPQLKSTCPKEIKRLQSLK